MPSSQWLHLRGRQGQGTVRRSLYASFAFSHLFFYLFFFFFNRGSHRRRLTNKRNLAGLNSPDCQQGQASTLIYQDARWSQNIIYSSMHWCCRSWLLTLLDREYTPSHVSTLSYHRCRRAHLSRWRVCAVACFFLEYVLLYVPASGCA